MSIEYETPEPIIWSDARVTKFATELWAAQVVELIQLTPDELWDLYEETEIQS